MRHLLTLAAALLATACHSVDSSQVATEDIRAELTVTSDGSGVIEVIAELEVEGHALGYVELVGGEALRVHARGYDLPMEARWFDYHVDVPVDRGEIEFQVRLERIYGRHAPDSWVQLPPRFDLYRNPGVYLLDWDVIPIEWDVIAGDEMRVAVDGPCVAAWERYVPARRDVGAVVLRPGDLAIDDGWDGSLCELDVTVERLRPGRLDPAFGGGFITAKQVRTSRVRVAY